MYLTGIVGPRVQARCIKYLEDGKYTGSGFSRLGLYVDGRERVRSPDLQESNTHRNANGGLLASIDLQL